jgi:putative alpha-1,2-mannosidase
MKGLLTKYDINTAFDAVKRNAMPGGMLGDSDADINFYTEKGYWPDNAGITVEAVFQDFAIAQMAKKLGKTADYALLHQPCARLEETCIEPTQKLLFPKDRKGKFAQYQSAKWFRLDRGQCLASNLVRIARYTGPCQTDGW